MKTHRIAPVRCWCCNGLIEKAQADEDRKYPVCLDCDLAATRLAGESLRKGPLMTPEGMRLVIAGLLAEEIRLQVVKRTRFENGEIVTLDPAMLRLKPQLDQLARYVQSIAQV